MSVVDEVYQRCSICIKHTITVSKEQHHLSPVLLESYLKTNNPGRIVFRNSMTRLGWHYLKLTDICSYKKWLIPLTSVTQIPMSFEKSLQMCCVCYGFGIIYGSLDAVLHKNSYYAFRTVRPLLKLYKNVNSVPKQQLCVTCKSLLLCIGTIRPASSD